MKMTYRQLVVAFFFAVLGAAAQAANPQVRITTSMGVVEAELYPDKAPKTVANFLEYVKAGHYSGTIFHRVIPDFMIQGGGFEPGMKEKNTRGPIEIESDNGLKNETGTLAMARTGDPNSASAQFFINTTNNDFLNFKSKTVQGWGYTVFGKVTKGMDVVHRIEATPTGFRGQFQDVPEKDVIIEKVELVGDAAAKKPAKK
jgi:peptidyl-prolyl cis-trans isomerase A (cyclophilin A)/peptidyl-prolyl cis-trans isomerase B (cyclophilin B)